MVAFIFPGQGSQKPGMGRELFESSESSQRIFSRIAEATSLDIEGLCFETDEETLRKTENAQVALYTAGLAAFAAVTENGFKASVFAGHSVGEYAALAAAGVITVEDGAKLVRTRGLLMSEFGTVVPGTMAAVLGLDAEAISPILAASEGIVVVANDNCPGQVVISGAVDAVTAVTPHLLSAGAKRVLPLNVSGAFHSPLMNEAADRMKGYLAECSFEAGAPVYSNVTTRPVDSPEMWRDLLCEQLRSSVLWTGSVQNMISDGVTTFVELGTGEVLCGLIRRIDKSRVTLAVQDAASLAKVGEVLGVS